MSNPASRRIIQPRGGPRPTSYYSHGIAVGGCVYTSGQTARDASGNIVGEESVAAQTEQALRNLALVLQDAGLQSTDIVAMRIFVRRDAKPSEVYRCLQGFLAGHAPAITLCMIEGLAYESYLVEIEAIACGYEQ
jgi:enamine deaminase RidA (YjgF/YER057c/UK114 family)